MNKTIQHKNAQLIKQEAQRLGFDNCGIAKARFLHEEAGHLESWLKNGSHGKMQYMENHFDKRLDPTKLVPGAKSIVSLIHNYTPSQVQNPNAPRIAKYAYGQDYHFVLKRKARQLMEFIQENIGKVEGRVFTDSAPIMDKVWAQQAGIGWLGKNSNLITKKGSYMLIAELIIDLELAYDTPIKDFCGTCQRCIISCPTKAIVKPGVVDGSKCISYFTIELRDKIPEQMHGKMSNNMFGCDICQDVCPWNYRSEPHNEPDFSPHPDLIAMTKQEWYQLSEEKYREIFKKSAVKRAKYTGLMRNLNFLKKT